MSGCVYEATNIPVTMEKYSAKDAVAKRILPLGFTPGSKDVICARGAAAYCHPGNIRFREIITIHLRQYSESTNRAEKSHIVSFIVDSIRAATPEGGFVREDEETNRWYEVGDHVAREKVGQSFRDSLHTMYRSSSKAKKRRLRGQKESVVTEADAIVSESDESDSEFDSKLNEISKSVETKAVPDLLEIFLRAVEDTNNTEYQQYYTAPTTEFIPSSETMMEQYRADHVPCVEPEPVCSLTSMLYDTEQPAEPVPSADFWSEEPGLNLWNF